MLGHRLRRWPNIDTALGQSSLTDMASRVNGGCVCVKVDAQTMNFLQFAPSDFVTTRYIDFNNRYHCYV